MSHDLMMEAMVWLRHGLRKRRRRRRKRRRRRRAF
jgi:hypothetical protein